MKKVCSLLIPFLLTTAALHATVRRVGFIATIQPVNGLDYVNFQAAHDASSAGDTIYLYANTTGAQAYSGTLNKALVVIGPGYFTNSYTFTSPEIGNSGAQIMAGRINSSTFNIDNGSAGSIFIGLNNVSFTTVDQVNALNNITIRRCRDVYISFVNSGQINNWTVSQCFGVRLDQSGYSGSFTGDRTIDNLVINNCVIYGALNLTTSPAGTYSGNKIYNCVFASGGSFNLNNASFTIQNCIFDGQSFSNTTNTTWIKNITTLASTSNVITNTAPNVGNQYSANLSNVFVGYPTNPLLSGINTYSNDARFALKAASVGLNGGFLPGTTTATDAGIFGGSGGTGTAPYILSGIPPIPTLTRLDAPSAVTASSGTYTITLSIKSNN